VPARNRQTRHTAPAGSIEREAILEAYIRTSPSFICPWGRDALRAGRVLFAAYPASATAEARIAALVATLHRFMNERLAAVIWPRSSAPTHARAYDQAWHFYTDFKIACREMTSGGCSESDRERIEREVERYQETGDWLEYSSSGIPSLCSEPLHLISVNHLYDRQHPLYAPVFAHVATRQSDLLQIRLGARRERSKRERWKQFVADFTQRKSTPFVQGLPYYLPGDPAMDHPQVRRSPAISEGMGGGCPFHPDGGIQAEDHYADRTSRCLRSR